MNSTDVIAAYFEKGGRVLKLEGTTPARVPEVLEYLGCRGITASYSPGERRLFLCNGKLITLAKLVEVANGQRRSQQLPAFVLRVRIRRGPPCGA
jgi:hypothetical protein